MIRKLRESAEWQLLFGAIWNADRPLAGLWWGLVVLRALLPAGFAIAMGVLVSSVQQGNALGGPLVAAGIVFVALQTLSPLHGEAGTNLGSKTSAWLHDR